ncbi:hypothetical protein SAMN06264849_10124 [Melghirimyces algeriensis]|uniref:Uncharacterized protein n=1 Tax=Melghirimyces algeriensis TaxID=910412 RepID=A0A521AB51_9BACL|nr:hypothetical protein SAMN06264849_10124 [Melghirimyces algeriensis]
MEHPFPTTQRTRFRSQPFSGYFVRWLGPEGVKRTPFTSLLEEKDKETEISLPPLCEDHNFSINLPFPLLLLVSLPSTRRAFPTGTDILATTSLSG